MIEIWGCYLMLLAAFVTDMRTMKIPNVITVTGICTGLSYHLFTEGWMGAWFAALGAATGFGLMFALYLLRAVGGGDVKLFAGIGAWTGITLTLSTMMYSILAAGCIGLLLLVWRRETGVRLRRIAGSVLGAAALRSTAPLEAAAKHQLQFPFMLAVLPGAVLAVYYM
ncbi:MULTISPECIES: A24 family peptidase [Paenibacillus]|jgi:prepilin peptidase CpaA|uniref:A24 family peptidase n=1 Tax=Paenibacillus TaxID=44249 RepID=UPI00073EEF4E|nr:MULTISPECIES: A24 family peptidase [Paenibacillus]MDU4694956.1 A24 family peptidase [Paenibacillus sp.]